MKRYQRNPILAFTALFLGASACHGKHKAHGEALRLPVTTPIRQDVALEDEYVAQLQAIQHIELRALERGYITDIHVDEGKLVPKGTKMFQIMPQVYDAELRRAQAERAVADVEYKNTERLAERNIVAESELQIAKARLSKAQAEQLLAETHRKLTEVRAPFTGLMGRFEVRLGSLVDEGELLTTLSDNSTLWAYFNVPEAEYLNFKARSKEEENAPIRLRMANGKLFEHPGTIETIVADFNNETGNIAFRASFPNPDGLLRHGETGNVILSRPLKNALVIPQAATFEILDQRFVFVVDEEGHVHQRNIAIGAEMPHLFVVQEGLRDHEQILLEGLRRVHDGDKIHAEARDPNEVLAHLEPHAE